MATLGPHTRRDTQEPPSDVVDSGEDHVGTVLIEVTGDLDPHGVEALRVELRRMAKQHGVSVSDITVEEIRTGE